MANNYLSDRGPDFRKTTIRLKPIPAYTFSKTLAEEYKDRIVIYKVNTEREPDLAAAFGIRSIPSILFIPKGGRPQMLQGAMPKQAFRQAIEEYLLK